ncbi:hypothetical protein ACT691_11735 [Vibrio metschnikovii]
MDAIYSRDGAVFAQLIRAQCSSHRPLDDSSIYRILRRAGDLLALPHLKFSGQSDRIGAVKELAEQGYHTKDIPKFWPLVKLLRCSTILGELHSQAVA